MRAGRLWEVLSTGAIAAAAIAIAASCFVRADSLSRKAYAQDVTLGRAQAVCDVLSGTCGDMGAVAGYLGTGHHDGSGVFTSWLDGSGTPCGQEVAEYVLSCGPATRDGLMGFADVWVCDGSGAEVIRFTASWQEEGCAYD